VRRDDGLIGENTDGQGFLSSLRTVADPVGLAFALFGAGGSTRAIAVEAALAGAAHLTVINRDPSRGQELVSIDPVPDARDGRSAGLGSRRRAARGRLGCGEHDVDRAVGSRGPPCHRMASLPAGTIVADVIPNPPGQR